MLCHRLVCDHQFVTSASHRHLACVRVQTSPISFCCTRKRIFSLGEGVAVHRLTDISIFEDSLVQIPAPRHQKAFNFFRYILLVSRYVNDTFLNSFEAPSEWSIRPQGRNPTLENLNGHQLPTHACIFCRTKT